MMEGYEKNGYTREVARNNRKRVDMLVKKASKRDLAVAVVVAEDRAQMAEERAERLCNTNGKLRERVGKLERGVRQFKELFDAQVERCDHLRDEAVLKAEVAPGLTVKQLRERGIEDGVRDLLEPMKDKVAVE